jgi:hypothetical protein
MLATGPLSSQSSESGHLGDLLRDARGEAYADLLWRLRGELAEEMARSGISRAELARRLGVRPSVVTRVMNPSADVLASTLFDFAWAMQREWQLQLKPRSDAISPTSNHAPPTISLQAVPAQTTPLSATWSQYSTGAAISMSSAG